MTAPTGNNRGGVPHRRVQAGRAPLSASQDSVPADQQPQQQPAKPSAPPRASSVSRHRSPGTALARTSSSPSGPKPTTVSEDSNPAAQRVSRPHSAGSGRPTPPSHSLPTRSVKPGAPVPNAGTSPASGPRTPPASRPQASPANSTLNLPAWNSSIKHTPVPTPPVVVPSRPPRQHGPPGAGGISTTSSKSNSTAGTTQDRPSDNASTAAVGGAAARVCSAGAAASQQATVVSPRLNPPLDAATVRDTAAPHMPHRHSQAKALVAGSPQKPSIACSPVRGLAAGSSVKPSVVGSPVRALAVGTTAAVVAATPVVPPSAEVQQQHGENPQQLQYHQHLAEDVQEPGAAAPGGDGTAAEEAADTDSSGIDDLELASVSGGNTKAQGVDVEPGKAALQGSGGCNAGLGLQSGPLLEGPTKADSSSKGCGCVIM